MKLIQTTQTKRALAKWLETKQPDETSNLYANDWIDHSLLISVSKDLVAAGPEYALAALVRGSGVYFEPAPPTPPKSQEYVQLMDRLRRDQLERDYQMITSHRETVGPMFDRLEAKEAKEQVTTTFNILLSVAAVAWAFWYWTASFTLAARTLMALFAAITVLVAEVVVYMGYKRRVEEARVIERNKKEKRAIKETVVFTSEGARERVDEKPGAATQDLANNLPAEETPAWATGTMRNTAQLRRRA